jgi:hypothetical protein
MISPEKQAANQANAQHSTGPKTPEGMARSAANSRTHPLGDPQAGGFCSKDNLVAAEDQEEFDQMAHGYQIDLSPEGAIEQTLADEIVAAAWQLRRMRRVETAACSGHDSYTAILDDDVLQKKLDRLARHKTRIERTFHLCASVPLPEAVQNRPERTLRARDQVSRDASAAEFRTNPTGSRTNPLRAASR